MTFCWKCPKCGYKMETNDHSTPECPKSPNLMIRDYRAEAAGVQVFISALGDGKVSTKHVQGDV